MRDTSAHIDSLLEDNQRINAENSVGYNYISMQ